MAGFGAWLSHRLRRRLFCLRRSRRRDRQEKIIGELLAGLAGHLGNRRAPAPRHAVLFPLVDRLDAPILLALWRSPQGFGHDFAAAQFIDEDCVLVLHDSVNVRNIFGFVNGDLSENRSDDFPQGFRQHDGMAEKDTEEAKTHAKESGERLRRIRRALGVPKLRRFAENTGIDEDNLSNWELGKALVPAWYIQRLKEIYGVSHDWIYGGDPARLPHDVAQKLLTTDKRVDE